MPTYDVSKAQKSCRSAVEDPNISLCLWLKTSDSASADLRDEKTSDSASADLRDEKTSDSASTDLRDDISHTFQTSAYQDNSFHKVPPLLCVRGALTLRNFVHEAANRLGVA